MSVRRADPSSRGVLPSVSDSEAPQGAALIPNRTEAPQEKKITALWLINYGRRTSNAESSKCRECGVV
jgi:hypothetical protein